MSFSDKMRDSLGAEGARIEVAPPTDTVAAGATGELAVTIVGGTRAATIDGLFVRLVEATRHWVAEDGSIIAESDAPPREERKGLTAGWERKTVAELQVEVGHTVDPGQSHVVSVALPIPEACQSSSVGCSHTVNVQADIKGQIDPTGNARVTLA